MCDEFSLRRSRPSPNRQSLRVAGRHRQSQGGLSRFPHAVERRRPRHSHPHRCQGGVHETEITGKVLSPPLFSDSVSRTGLELRVGAPFRRLEAEGYQPCAVAPCITSLVPSPLAAYRMPACHGKRTDYLPVLPLASTYARCGHRRRRNTHRIRAS
jgi:hypothetical protein